MPQPRILLAEANASFRDAILRVLAAVGGCSVVASVADGEAAVQAALSQEPDIVLLDIGISDSSGMKIAKELHLLLPEMRVVLLLTDDHSTYRRAAAECGAGWVAKDRLTRGCGLSSRMARHPRGHPAILVRRREESMQRQ